MGKMIYLMGKSSSGKDTVYRELMKDTAFRFKKVVTYTTRPIRDKETEGVQYHFTDEEGFKKLSEEGKVIEDRVYHTCYGPWRYFTVDDGSIDLSRHNYLIIGTLESYRRTAEYFGHQNVAPVYLEVDDGIRLQRALNREMRQEEPKYEEMCRRYLADAEDFSEEKLTDAEVFRRFRNENLKECLAAIHDYIVEILQE